MEIDDETRTFAVNFVRETPAVAIEEACFERWRRRSTTPTGTFSVISAGIGVVSLAIAVDGFWDTVGVIFLGAPIALLLASWPFALGEALRAIADIGDRVGTRVETD